MVVGEATGFAHTSDLSEGGLAQAARAAAAAARGGSGQRRAAALGRVEAPAPHEVEVLPETVAKAAKVELLGRADEAARSAGAAISQVSARYADGRRRILVANSDGAFGWRRPGADPVRGVVRGGGRHRHADRV